jgi:hypothetical protein
MLGLTREELAAMNEIEIWPDNFDAYRLFEAMRTQWRIGFGGPTGLDYSVLKSVAELIGLAGSDGGMDQELFAKVRHMEFAVLAMPRK